MLMVKKIRKSVSLKLSITNLLLAMAIFFVSVGFLFQRSIHVIRQEAVEHATFALNTVQLRVGQYLNEIETVTENTDWLVQENFQPDSLFAFSRRVVELNPNISGCSITSEPYYFPEKGRYFSVYSVRTGDSVTTVREAEYEYFDKVWYRIPRDLGKHCWVDPFYDHTEGTLSADEMIASYCKPLFDSTGHIIGVISTDLSLPKLSKAISSERPYPHSYFVMIGTDGRYFVHPDSTKLVNSTIFEGYHSDMNELGNSMLAGKQGHMEVNINGKPCIVCFKPLPDTPWSIALVSPESDIFSKYIQLVCFLLPLLLAGLLLIMLFTYYLVSYAIKPLHKLAKQSQFIAAGHYDIEMQHSRRRDTVGRLQNSFVVMQKALVSHINSIEQMNSEMAQHNEKLLEANHMAREGAKLKMAFIQNMTHQIRTPLNIVMGFSQILRDEGKQMSEEEVKNLTGLIDHNTVTISRMVAMLYDTSDVGTVALSLDDDVPVNQMARDTIADSCHQFPGLHVDFHSDVPESLCIRTNRLYLFRSLRELFYNSAKYSDGAHVKLHISATDTIVRFVIEDKGPGIAEKDLERVFLPFSKTNDLSEGLGLGLPLTRRHAHNLGGSLTIDTNYKEGCRIIIELPNNSHLVSC